jgi:hypothetical protein
MQGILDNVVSFVTIIIPESTGLGITTIIEYGAAEYMPGEGFDDSIG